MSLLAVTVLGHDRPGIVADTTAALAGLGGNLEDSTMTLLRGHFAMLLLVRTTAGASAVQEALAGLTADGRLTVDVRPVPDLELHAATAAGRPYVLSVHGADRPGIVGALTGVVAGARGNVTDLTTRLSGDLYVLVAEVTLPTDADADLVQAALATTAEELGVDVSFRRLDTDELWNEPATPLRLPPLPPGSVRDVVRAPARVLSEPGSDVDPTDPQVVRLAADLLATQAVSPGCVGLAAQQVGVPWRVFSVDVSAHPKARTGHGAFVLCNAAVLEASRWERGREGCMSVPDLTGDVKRARRLVVRGALPVTGEVVTITTDAFEAVALQHEIDHTDGALFLDRVAGAHALHARRTYL